MEQTQTASLMEEAKAKTEIRVSRSYEAVNKKGYKVHPLDQLVEGRMKTVRRKNEDGTTSSARLFVPYVKPRYERYVGFVNLGNKYPFGSKRQGFNND